jgi:hypothetical protein
MTAQGPESRPASSRHVRRRELGGPDPLDRRLGVLPTSGVSRLFSFFRSRSALGLAPSVTPAVIFIPVGFLLGPRALGVLSEPMFDWLHAAVAVALAVLGVLVGIAVGRWVRVGRRLLIAASLQGLITFLVVAAAVAVAVGLTGDASDAPFISLALTLGVCAAVSSATSADPVSNPAGAEASRVADLDDVLPIVVATIALALLPTVPGRGVWLTLAAPVVAGLAVGVVGWLLFERAESGAERVVFVLGALALAGGAAAYAHVSPLTVGLIAGWLWSATPGRADEIIYDDLRKVQHPLVVLLLVTAGVFWVPLATSIWLVGPYVLFRLAGKVIGAWAAAPIAGVRPSLLAAYLVPSGVLAVAFGLNFMQILPAPVCERVLATVVAGTITFELLGLVVVPEWRRRDA